jgi:hypothetical protein
METSDIRTLSDMVRAAEALRVPLYDDRVGRLKADVVNQARLVYDPAAGQMTAGDGR